MVRFPFMAEAGSRPSSAPCSSSDSLGRAHRLQMAVSGAVFVVCALLVWRDSSQALALCTLPTAPHGAEG
jgi:hypothetical protein